MRPASTASGCCSSSSAAASDRVAAEDALDFNLSFGLAFLKPIILGDLVNDVGYKMRPYEVNAGETDRTITEAKRMLGETLRKVRKMLDNIEVDYTRVKPKVKITGEFWAQTTEGDGNYHMFRWLESEGAEVLVEPIGTWIEYLIWISRQDAQEQARAEGQTSGRFLKHRLIQKAFRTWFDLYRRALGYKTDPLPDQDKLAEYASQYYETHLGVAKVTSKWARTS